MNHPFAYIGCFVNYQDLHAAIRRIRRDPLELDIEDPHVTFVYMPEEVDRSLFGKKIAITLVGYGNDGENEGLLVRLSAADGRLQAMIGQIEVPHITVAVSRVGKAVNTRRLAFEKIDPIRLEGRFGGYLKTGKAVLCGSGEN